MSDIQRYGEEEEQVLRQIRAGHWWTTSRPCGAARTARSLTSR